MLTLQSIMKYTESLKTTYAAFTPRQSVFFMPFMAWMRAGNIQYRPKHSYVAFSESTPLLILNGEILRKHTMINAISVFKFNQNQIRTTTIDGNPWFCLVDCRAALGLAKTTKSQIRLPESGVRKQHLSYTSGSKRADFINEPNLYRLIFRSNKPQAQAFADWVYSEVLPSIRKTGAYQVHACGEVAVKEHTRSLPSGKKEIVLSDKAKSEIGGIVKAIVQAELMKVFAGSGLEVNPSGMPFANWAVSAVHAVGAMQSEYHALKQKQQEVIRLLESDKE